MARAEQSGRWVLTENRRLRLFSFFLLYLAQGIPFGLTVTAIPAWMAANGAGDAQVGELVAWAYFAWTYKFVVAALMDRFTFLPMGRRRIWLIGAQLLMALGLLGAAMVNPGPTEYALLVLVTLLVNTGAATQDVAVDGLAVDVLPEHEQGTASAYMFGGQAFGIAAAGAAGGAGLQFLGPQTTFLLFIPLLLIPTIYAIVIRENPGERMLPWSEGQPSPAALAVFTPRYFGRDGQLMITLRSLIKGPSLVLILAQSLGRTASGVITPLLPILGTGLIGLSAAQYTSTIGTVDLAMSVVGLAIGGWISVRLGAQRATYTNMLALAGLIGFMIVGQPLWVQYPVFLAVLVIWSLLILLNSVFSNPLRMQLSDKRVGATQFTIYNSLANLPVALGAWMMGQLGGSSNLGLTLGVAAGLFAASGVVYALLRMPAAAKEDPAAVPPDELAPARVD